MHKGSTEGRSTNALENNTVRKNRSDLNIPIIKCLVLGNASVGKTSILVRYVDNIFNFSTVASLGVDFSCHNLTINGTTVRLQLWDTSGQEHHRAITRTYYRGTHAIVLVYDITDRKSFNDVGLWIDDINKELGTENVFIVLVGNKLDLDSKRIVSEIDGKRVADSYGIPFFETSAKDGQNLDKLFEKVATTVFNSEAYQKQKDNKKTTLEPPQQKDKCC